MDYLHLQISTSAPKTPLPLDLLVPGAEEGPGPFRLAVLLHDIAGNNTFWLRRYPVEDIFRGTGTIVAMPSCLNSFYVNMYYGYDMLDYITRELPELVGRWLRVSDRREDRLIAGVGMGGYGAVRAALAEPWTYAKALSLDGLLDPEIYYDQPIPSLRMEDIFGPRGHFLQRTNNLLAAVKECRTANISGAGLPGIFLNQTKPEASAGYSKKLAQALQEAGFTVSITAESAEAALRQFASNPTGSAAGNSSSGGENNGTD